MRSERKSPGLGVSGLWSCLNRWSELWGVQPHGNRTMQKLRLPGRHLNERGKPFAAKSVASMLR
jgi:hypothetical protein